MPRRGGCLRAARALRRLAVLIYPILRRTPSWHIGKVQLAKAIAIRWRKKPIGHDSALKQRRKPQRIKKFKPRGDHLLGFTRVQTNMHKVPGRAKHGSQIHTAGILGINLFPRRLADLSKDNGPEGVGQVRLMIMPPKFLTRAHCAPDRGREPIVHMCRVPEKIL